MTARRRTAVLEHRRRTAVLEIRVRRTLSTKRRTVAGALLLGVGLMLAGCGDDAPDRAYQAERAAVLAAEYRAATAPATAPTTVAQLATSSAEPVENLDQNLPASTNVAAATVTPTGVVVTVIALDNSFRPQQLTIQAGDEVLWENNGRNEHNILNIESVDDGFAADEAWGIDVAGFQPGEVFAHVFTEPGSYRYYCTIHGNTEVGMVGTIIVEG